MRDTCLCQVLAIYTMHGPTQSHKKIPLMRIVSKTNRRIQIN
jgi:hypothetical protein